MRKVFFILPLIFHLCCIQAQDTIKIGKSAYYSSDSIHSRTIATRSEIPREDIIFNDTKTRVEYCYYYDGKRRVAFGETYELLNDSTIQLGDNDEEEDFETWTYKLEDSLYKVWRKENGSYEEGYVSTLIPFDKKGIFKTYNYTKNETLWETDYSHCKINKLFPSCSNNFPQSKIKGKVFIKKDVENIPTLLNNDSLPTTITKSREKMCYNEPYGMKVHTMSFIVTKEGNIKNIKQEFGFFDMDFCPYYIMELMKIISNYGKLNPAIRKGKPVNYKHIISIDMMEDAYYR